MKSTHYVQNLLKPTGRPNPYSFGAGGNGGLSEKAANALSKIWAFDYMGVSRFERGKVAKSLQAIADYGRPGRMDAGSIPLIRPVWYICESRTEGQVEERIKQLAENESEMGLVAPTCFKECLHDEEYAQHYRGWLELDNDFMFFIDPEMHKRACDFFKKNGEKR